MGRIHLLLASMALLLSACRSSDTKFDPWEEEENNWSLDSGDSGTSTPDADHDGWDADEDCDDLDAAIHPEAEELCDGVDNDCDTEIDEDVLLALYLDADGDGYGLEDSALESCIELPGYAEIGGDCDDSTSEVYPDAPEQCDALDNDCDGQIDEDVLSTWYADSDADGYGNAAALLEDCDPPSGYVADSTDCDDAQPTVYPGAEEWCDGLDNDCDGSEDNDAIDESDYSMDADGDGFGDPDQTVESCEQPSGYVLDDSDCLDSNYEIHPDASEICDALDNDCDGLIDDEDSSLSAETWYGDSDGDGYGGTTFTQVACDQPSNFVDNADDCDDLDEAVSPGSSEICNEIDDDCDGHIDDADASLDSSTASTWYADSDGDGFGDPDLGTQVCEAPSATTEDDSDCNDTDDTIHPEADEVCDGLDNDCDGDIDPGFTDTDGDGTANCVDPSIFADDFNDSSWDEWTYVDLGGGNSPNWSMNGSYLHEGSNAALSIAYGPDLGELETYTITVDAFSGGGLNNSVGIAFALQDEDNYFLLEWDDFNDYYGTYSPAGEVILWECIAGSCDELESDDDSIDIAMDYLTWTELALSVDGSAISFSVDGTTVLEHSYTGTTPIGADHTGVYTYDNDYTVYYDDFEVTQP